MANRRGVRLRKPTMYWTPPPPLFAAYDRNCRKQAISLRTHPTIVVLMLRESRDAAQDWAACGYLGSGRRARGFPADVRQLVFG